MDELARNYFKTSELEDIKEIYEQEIFELKQFFLSKAPISKLFKGRISKLLKLQEAFERVKSSDAKLEIDFSEPKENSNLLDSYLSFQAAKNNLRLLITNELDGANLIQWVEMLIQLEKHNAKQWYSERELEETDDIIVSKEPNPIDIFEAIKEYQKQGGFTLQQIKDLENNPPNVLVQEMKRLSLLFKKF